MSEPKGRGLFLAGAMRLDDHGLMGELFCMALITVANARRMAAKSHDARRERKFAGVCTPAMPQLAPQLADYVALKTSRACGSSLTALTR